MWERGKNRLSITSQRIREALSPPGSPEPGQSGYYNGGELSDDSDEDGDGDKDDSKEKEEEEEEDKEEDKETK